MAHCTEMKVDQIWHCEVCGLEIKVVKECTCSEDPSSPDACPQDAVLICCSKPLVLKG
jgi:hypothetical protein